MNIVLSILASCFHELVKSKLKTCNFIVTEKNLLFTKKIKTLNEMIYGPLFYVNLSRLIGKPDHLGLDLAYLLQFFPYVFHLLLLPYLDQFHFLLGIVELDVGIHIEGDGYIAVAHQVLEGLGAHSG